MVTSTIFYLLPLVALTTAIPLIPSCNCGLGPGEDVCGSKRCAPMIIRPHDVPRPVLPCGTTKKVIQTVEEVPAPCPLVPIPGPCGCSRATVTPAVVPRPPCASCGGVIDINSNQQYVANQQQQIVFGGPGRVVEEIVTPVLVETDVVVGPGNPAGCVPADPVSLQLAYKLAQECSGNINEDRLSFGFRSIPKDVPIVVKKSCNNIAEENLYSLNGQIVELKKTPCAVKSVDEEAQDLLEALAEEEEDVQIDNAALKQISLAELGYGPAKIAQPQFVDVSANINLNSGSSASSATCNDGFLPGTVSIKESPVPQTFVLPPSYPPPCDDDVYIPAPPAPSPVVFSNPVTYVSSSCSSSAASSNSYKQSILMQKLGCN